MRVFVAGASGVIGRRLVPQLLERGHEVVGTCRSPERADRIRELGAEPVVVDLLDADGVDAAVAAARPDAIVHQATALSDLSDLRRFDRSFAMTNRLRTEGTDALVEAGRRAGVRRLVAQSFASHRYERTGGPVKSEDDPLDPSPPAAMRETHAAMRHLEGAVEAAGGVALRYGIFYGPGDEGLVDALRKRRFPLVGEGGGVWSFVHLDDAAAATVRAVESEVTGVYNVVDDDPAPVRVWLPAVAEAIGAPPPRRVPRWLARIVAGEVPVFMSTEVRGAANAKAKRELDWTPRYPSWREGFAAAYGNSGDSER